MSYCQRCGSQVNENIKFCPSCGTEVGQSSTKNSPSASPAAASQNILQKLGNTSDTTSEYDQKDINDNKIFAVLSYLGILVLVPWFAAPNSKFARYHAKQGITLCILYIVYAIICFLLGLIKTTRYIWGIPYQTTPGIILVINWIIGIPLFVLSILGIINAVQGKAKELPVIGKIKIIK